MPRILKKLACLGFALSAVTGLSSCTEEEITEKPLRWSISFRWSTEPELDLDSDWAMAIRGAIESNTIAQFLNLEYGYPGWTDLRASAVDLDAHWPHPPLEGIGTAYFHLIKYETPAGTDAAIVCKDMTLTAKKIGDTYPHPNRDNAKEILEAIQVDVGRVPLLPPNKDRYRPVKTPDGPTIPGPPGRSPRPSGNVFSRIVDVYYPHGNAQGDRDRNHCLPWAESRWRGTQPPQPNRPESEPPQIEPFFPGWQN
ncbi:hypothetical protein [Nocardia barduliensis]|uniref:hypothetical protein n=1 Tax=Nocardia barduliensis TaxID=2736643 RepID=UPI001571C037|nr:hypothetical protein [Nocardia barduliensis]